MSASQEELKENIANDWPVYIHGSASIRTKIQHQMEIEMNQLTASIPKEQ